MSFLTVRTNDHIFRQDAEAPDAKHYLLSKKNGHFYVDTASTKYGQVVGRTGSLLFEASAWSAEVFNKFYPAMKSSIDESNEEDPSSYMYQGKTRMLATVPGIEPGQRYDLCQDDRLPDGHWLVVGIENTSTELRAVFEVVRRVPCDGADEGEFGPESFRRAVGGAIEPVPNARLVVQTGGESAQRFIGFFLTKVEDHVWASAKIQEQGAQSNNPRPR